MLITWYGDRCIRIEAKRLDGCPVAIVIDPVGPKALPKAFTADLALWTHQEEMRDVVGGTPYTIATPGEYDTRGVLVYGVAARNAAGLDPRVMTVFYGEIEGLSFTHLGARSTLLEDTHLETVEDTHILFLPVGGGDVLTPERAAEVVAQVSPRIVIPIAYAVPGSVGKKESVDRFLKVMGASGVEPVNALKITASEIPTTETRCVVLNMS